MSNETPGQPQAAQAHARDPAPQVADQDQATYEKRYFHERAGESRMEFRKTLVSLATASVGGLLVVVTAKIEPPLTAEQRRTLLRALVLFAPSVGLGLIAWLVDSHWSWFRAKHGAVEAKGWKHLRDILDSLMVAGFFLGVAYAFLYVWSRARSG